LAQAVRTLKRIAIKRIAIFHHFGHKLAEEAEACLIALHRAGIPAHLGDVQHGHNILSVKMEEDIVHATSLLRAYGFEVMALP
jgi:hypothetical protein